MRIIDLSIPVDNDLVVDPPGQQPRVVYQSHTDSGAIFEKIFPPLRREQLPDGLGWATEWVELSTHSGTHVDAPWHYHPTMDGGIKALAIDEVPLEWFWQPGVKLDFRHLPDGYVVSPQDIDDELKRIGHVLRPLEIVLAQTAAGERLGEPDYLDTGCGFGRDATLHLTRLGVRVVGTDAWSWDAPFSSTARRFAETQDPSIIWEGHKAGMVQGYCQIEKLTNLAELPHTGFRVACFPVRITRASAGWTRAVAILEEESE